MIAWQWWCRVPWSTADTNTCIVADDAVTISAAVVVPRLCPQGLTDNDIGDIPFKTNVGICHLDKEVTVFTCLPDISQCQASRSNPSTGATDGTGCQQQVPLLGETWALLFGPARCNVPASVVTRASRNLFTSTCSVSHTSVLP